MWQLEAHLLWWGKIKHQLNLYSHQLLALYGIDNFNCAFYNNLYYHSTLWEQDAVFGSGLLPNPLCWIQGMFLQCTMIL